MFKEWISPAPHVEATILVGNGAYGTCEELVRASICTLSSKPRKDCDGPRRIVSTHGSVSTGPVMGVLARGLDRCSGYQALKKCDGVFIGR